MAGAAGHVGRAATVLAVRAGARVIATARGTDLEACRSLGAHTALDYRDPDLAQHLKEAAAGIVSVLLDTSGHHDLDRPRACLQHEGASF